MKLRTTGTRKSSSFFLSESFPLSLSPYTASSLSQHASPSSCLKQFANNHRKLEYARKMIQLKARDHTRTPMQWDATPNAGSCRADVKPWQRFSKEECWITLTNFTGKYLKWRMPADIKVEEWVIGNHPLDTHNKDSSDNVVQLRPWEGVIGKCSMPVPPA